YLVSRAGTSTVARPAFAVPSRVKSRSVGSVQISSGLNSSIVGIVVQLRCGSLATPGPATCISPPRVSAGMLLLLVDGLTCNTLEPVKFTLNVDRPTTPFSSSRLRAAANLHTVRIGDKDSHEIVAAALAGRRFPPPPHRSTP